MVALWTNATTRRQIPFTALIIGVLAESGDIDPVVILSCIFMEDETSEMQVDGNDLSDGCIHLVVEQRRSSSEIVPWDDKTWGHRCRRHRHRGGGGE